jgi:membrane protein YdbS with pleckstrin-like domain
MIESNETSRASSMKFVAIFCALAASLGAALLWKSGGSSPWLSMGVAAGVVLVASVVTTWIRNRRRRELVDLRDSALW